MHSKISNFWSVKYDLTVNEDSVLLYSVGRTDEAKDLWMKLNLKENIARQIEELPVIFGGIEGGNPVISGNEAKGIFRHLISASLAGKRHMVCVPDTKRHVKIIKKWGKEREYYRPTDRIKQCPPEKPCFVCRWFGTAGYESPLYFSFLKCNRPFKEVMSGVIPMIAFDEEFGGTAGEALVGFIGVKGGTKFNGEITGINFEPTIVGALFDVAKASEKGFVKFGRLRTRGFGVATITFKEFVKYSVAPFKEERKLESEDLYKFLEECHGRYAEFASKPSEPTEVKLTREG